MRALTPFTHLNTNPATLASPATHLTLLLPVYICDLKPEARRLGLELGAVKAFSPVELSNAVAAADPFTVHVVVDFAASAQSERSSPSNRAY